MTHNGVVAAGGRLTDWVSLGVLASSVPRDAVDDAVAVTGKQARRRDGKLPPHVVVYLVMALALFADDDYEEAAAQLTQGAFLGRWRLMSIDGFEWDAPDTRENAAAFGFSGAGPDDLGRAAFPK